MFPGRLNGNDLLNAMSCAVLRDATMYGLLDALDHEPDSKLGVFFPPIMNYGGVEVILIDVV
jgi:hypothetical protein